MPSREQSALKRLANEYSRDGYRVILSPLPNSLPEPLRGFPIDMLATRGEETVVVEVKKPTSRKPDERLLALAEAVKRMPNYRFDFIALPSEPKPGPKDTMSAAELSKRVIQARELLSAGMPEAAIVLLWSVTEGALRLLSARERFRVRLEGPSVMLKNLYSRGLLDKSDYSLLQRVAQYRNSAVHGYRVEEIDQSVLREWFQLIETLVRRI
jgi:hypothetical protein